MNVEARRNVKLRPDLHRSSGFETTRGMETDYNPPQSPLVVLHEDAEVLAIDKPSGLLSVPGKGAHLADCLQRRVEAAFPHALLVHRLDRDTSGVIVFALTAHAQRFLSMEFEKRKAKKTYIARVWGHLIEKSGHIDLPLIVDWPNRPKQMVDHDNGKPAETDWRLLRHDKDNTSRVRLYPKTGRSHQLRVHMQAIGHPILGDPFYAEGPARNFERLMLHAEELRISHPGGGPSLRFRVPSPF